MNDNLHRELKEFVQTHPQGWSHDEWLRLLYRLAESGFDTEDADAIGLELERHRLVQALTDLQLKGLGPKRIQAIAGHFGTLWNLKAASAQEVAGLQNVSEALARDVVDRIR